MINFIEKITNKIFDFASDESKKISQKFLIVIGSLTILLLIDNIIGFSYNYSLSNKIDQVAKLNAIISDSTLDSFTKNRFIELRKETLTRKNIIDKTYNYLTDFTSTENNLKVTKDNKKETTIVKPNYFLFHFTSSGVYYALAILFFPLFLILDKTNMLLQRIIMGIILSSSFIGMALLFYYICTLIPMLLENSWTLNYIANLSIQLTLIFLIVKIQKKTK